MKDSVPVFNVENFTVKHNGKDVYCDTLSNHLNKHPNFILPHKQNFFLTILFTEGTGVHEIDFVPHRIARGNISLVAPGQLHSLKINGHANGIVFLHNAGFYDLNFTHKRVRHFPFFCSMYNTSCVKVKGLDFEYFYRLFHLICSEFTLNSLTSESKICSLIDIIYTDITRIYKPKETVLKNNNSYLQKYIRFEEFISRKYQTVKSPAVYAELMHLSEKHLNRICKLTINKTAGDVIHEQIILEGKRLLAAGNYSISEVASMLGYDDPTYFSRLFKIKNKISPSEFMKRYHSERGHRD